MPLIHLPMRPPRNLIGERVYTKRWSQLMDADVPIDALDPRSLLARILIDMMADYDAEPIQRQATVAATFIMWLGTNFGQSLLWEAKNIRASRNRHDATLLSWCSLNVRSIGINYGWRTIEHMLMRTPRRKPRCSVMDYETIEHICIWLDCEEGAAFVKTCQEEIERRRAEPEPANKDIEIVDMVYPAHRIGRSTYAQMGGIPDLGEIIYANDRPFKIAAIQTGWDLDGVQLRVLPIDEPPYWAHWRENASNTDRRSV